MDLFADNDELFAKLKGGNPGYDVIVPTNDTLERMIKADMVIPLDHSKIPNMANIDKPFQDAQFDPGRKFSMPYMWGTLGIGYRKSAVSGAPDSWKVLFDSDEYAGAISLLGDQSNVLGAGLKYLGFSWNSTNPDELKKVEELLIRQKKNIKVFADDNGQDLLASGEVKLCQEWNGDIKQVMAEDDDIAYVVPKEGSLLWQDTLAIPKGAPHPENAHAFINFVLDAEAGKEIAETIQYATANKAAKDLMPDDYKNNPVIFPPAKSSPSASPASISARRPPRSATRSGPASRRPDAGQIQGGAAGRRPFPLSWRTFSHMLKTLRPPDLPLDALSAFAARPMAFDG